MFASAEINPAVQIERADGTIRDGLAMLAWDDAAPLWRSAVNKFAGAALYHREPWLQTLCGCYGLNLQMAALFGSGELRAAAMFARCRGLFSTRLVSLPFSDQGEVLAADDDSRDALLHALAGAPGASAMEVRGVAGPAPWVNVDCFLHWEVDLTRPFDKIYPTFGRQVKHKAKKARKENVSVERGASLDHMRRFYELQLETRRRFGLPPQPWRFFASVHEAFSRSGDCEIWLATHEGRVAAGLVVLRDGGTIYYKWGARREDGPAGASHLLGMSLIEEFAGKAACLDLGRSDARNAGLNRFKEDLGGQSRPLPYTFLPSAPKHISSEVTSGPVKLARMVWKRLPLGVTRVAGELMYRYLA
ncbi:MAG TPA: GNAT family N-acetyltransferase [Candidatus Binataceae bacterium]|nr:GNAT family N-acetyltransferase [Candidatus Binataceae bacterium]